MTRNPNQLQFVTSAVNLQGCPRDANPEVAVVGRSNSGKSSMINGLAKARIAQVSGTPGKTRLLNFYQGPKYRLVDMPGYGFAARSGNERREWQEMIENFLALRENLVGLLIIMDIRRDWSEEEENLVRWLSPLQLPAAVVLTKADKLSRSAALQRVREVKKQSGLENLLVTSTLNKQGFTEVDDFIFKAWIRGDAEIVDEEEGLE